MPGVDDEERWSDAPDMQSVLDLEPLDRDLFRAHNAISARNRRSLYGGQVAAQALRAAGLTVDPERHAHSLHGYFLRPGRADRPVILHVDRDRDGRSFSARHVRAVQEGEVIFSMLASFHVDEPSSTYDSVPTKTPRPPADDVDARGDFIIEMHEITPMKIEGERILYPDSMWIRLKDPLVDDDRLARACALTYMSDMGSGFGQLRVDGLPSGGASIDHAVWFHQDIAVDGWLLLELHPSKAGGSRGVYTGGVRDQHGLLGLMCAQELLLRPHPPEHVAAMRAMIEGRTDGDTG
ncbi:MAG TPA: acyl-CoA thioesterase domain-containing protein [Acidimicrobiales bacterium]|nr:acyl-CoA thioesterase domain-containing protein [Acidimicrobiales bacterium]